MATTTVPSNEQSSTNKNDHHLEIFSITWLDANDDAEIVQRAEKELRAIINHFKRFKDPNECQKYIEKKSNHDRLVVIVNHQFGQEIVPLVHKLRQVSSIYVYDENAENDGQWTKDFVKVEQY